MRSIARGRWLTQERWLIPGQRSSRNRAWEGRATGEGVGRRTPETNKRFGFVRFHGVTRSIACDSVSGHGAPAMDRATACNSANHRRCMWFGITALRHAWLTPPTSSAVFPSSLRVPGRTSNPLQLLVRPTARSWSKLLNKKTNTKAARWSIYRGFLLSTTTRPSLSVKAVQSTRVRHVVTRRQSFVFNRRSVRWLTRTNAAVYKSCLHVQLKLHATAQNCLNCLGSFGQFGAIACYSHAVLQS